MKLTSYLILSVSLMSVFFLSSCKKAKGNEPKVVKEFKVAVEAQEIKQIKLSVPGVYTGMTMPWRHIALSFKASGRLRKLKFEEGSYVKKGQLLGLIQDVDYYLGYNLAKIQVKTLTPDYNRVKTLTKQKAIPGAQWDRIKGRMEAAKTQVKQADSMYMGTRLRAPFDGIIEKKMVDVGDMVAPSRPVGILLDMSKVKITIGIPENELNKFKKGNNVDVFVPALNQKLKGVVHNISYTAEPGTFNYIITIACENPMKNGEYLLRAGMTAKVILPSKVNHGIFLPLPSVIKSTTNKKIVFVIKNNKAYEKEVKLGNLFNGKVQILSGISEGDIVVTKGAQYLKDGFAVTIEKLSKQKDNGEISFKSHNIKSQLNPSKTTQSSQNITTKIIDKKPTKKPYLLKKHHKNKL